LRFRRKRYRLWIANPWVEHQIKRKIFRDAEKYLRYKEGVRGKLKPIGANFYLEVEEVGDERFEMPYAEVCFKELYDDVAVAFYMVKVYFHLDGEFVYVSEAKKGGKDVCNACKEGQE